MYRLLYFRAAQPTATELVTLRDSVLLCALTVLHASLCPMPTTSPPHVLLHTANRGADHPQRFSAAVHTLTVLHASLCPMLTKLPPYFLLYAANRHGADRSQGLSAAVRAEKSPEPADQDARPDRAEAEAVTDWGG